MRFLVFILCFATAVLGHMQLVYPAPFGADNNPHRTDPVDEFLQYPYNCCGRTTPFPCGGYLSLLGTPQGAPTASWEAGSEQNWTIAGIGNHYGGSCQVGFSVDKGKTFQVATSYQGNCPHRNSGSGPEGQAFKFTVPADIPTGGVVFAWTWFNREQEFNMNCAAVTITDSGAAGNVAVAPAPTSAARLHAPLQPSSTYVTDGCTCTCDKPPAARAMLHHNRAGGVQIHHTPSKRDSSMPFHERPGLLIADDGNGCLTPHTVAEVKYPHPGPEIVAGDGEYPLQLPTPADKCGY
ncbi:MAG: hypothetical protein M4579_004259 [Chaenotheca gracillima]|nr:MAG: hypothetical protein M4579_004259 [Chaenotheca gracillima]